MSIFDSATFVEVGASRGVSCHCICVAAGHSDVCERVAKPGETYVLALTGNGGSIPICARCATALRRRQLQEQAV